MFTISDKISGQQDSLFVRHNKFNDIFWCFAKSYETIHVQWFPRDDNFEKKNQILKLFF